MREIRLSGSEGGGTKPIASPYPYFRTVRCADELIYFLGKAVARASCDSRDASATFDRGTEIVQLPSIP